MNITRTAIVNNRTTWVMLLVILLAGFSAYLNMPRDYDPGFIIRTAQVVTHFPGASPARVEQLISDPLEKLVQEIPELDSVVSESRTGVSIIKVNIKESYTQMRPIWDKLRRKIDNAATQLPEGVRGPFVNDEFGDVFGVVLGLTGEGFNYAELKSVADEARDALLRIPEAAKVDIFGEQEERIFIDYNNARLAELDISPYQLMQTLSARNIVVPGGYITLPPERIALEPSGNFNSVEDIRRTIVQLPGRRDAFYLEDIANVYRGYIDPSKSKVQVSGVRGLSIAVSMRHGGNIIALGDAVKHVINRLQANYPIGLEFETISFSPSEVENKVNSFVGNLVQAIVVVAAVMLFSLGLRTGLIVAALIPCSMIMAILVMSVFNIGLDQISLAALIIALGMLVDNGIVMSENIMVQMEDGKSAFDAAVDSATELRVPLLTSSLTTAAAFLPIYLAESNTGEYTAPLFKVVTITLLCSWILALTVIPLLCVYFLKVKKTQSEGFNAPFYSAYRAVLQRLLQHRVLTLVITVVLFFAAIAALKYVPNIFFPPSDRAYFKMEFELPIGTSIERTETVVRGMEHFIQDTMNDSGITNWVSYIGNGGPRFLLTHTPQPASPHYALMIINVRDHQLIDDVMLKLDRYALHNYPDLQLKLKRFENGAPIENPVEIRLSGKDTDRLFQHVARLKQHLLSLPGVKSVSDDWGRRTKKLLVDINQEQARRASISSQDIAVSLQTLLSGLELSQYREGDQIIPIMLRSTANDREDIGKLETLAVYSQASGRSVPLKQVADIRMVWEAAKIMRRDRSKTVTIGAQLQPGINAMSVFNQLLPWMNEQQTQWPPGYRYEAGGEMESSQKANQSIAAKLPIAAFIIVILLVAQFNSIRKPLIILVTIPLGVIGVIVGLLGFNSYFGFMTLLGIISLAGIVINNAIVLLERIKLEIDVNGLTPQQAIIEAAQRRMRPILLTTATTVFGLIPLYLGGGEMWEPMAVAIMVGLLFSTLLTLGIVPVLYALLYGIHYKGFRYEESAQ